jgi:multisubunit Na+/H+ antiporter MnhF subunit
MTAVHPAATDHLPMFITAPGQTDVLMVVMWLVFVGAILAGGVFFFWLHSLPERMVHNKIQFDIVAVLALLSLFTHQHAFWVAALLIALISFPDFKFPDFSGLLARIANSLESIASRPDAAGQPGPSAPTTDDQQRSAAPEKSAEVAQAKAKFQERIAVAVVERTTVQPKSAHKREREKAEG